MNDTTPTTENLDRARDARRIELGRWRRDLQHAHAILVGRQRMGEIVETEWLTHLEEIARYNAAVHEHNAPINAQRTQRRLATQRENVVRENAAAAAKVRAQRCDRCFTVPSASGVCLCD